MEKSRIKNVKAKRDVELNARAAGRRGKGQKGSTVIEKFGARV